MSENENKRRNPQQTSAQAVIRMLKKHKAFDEQSAIGYDVLKKVKLTTPVMAYTIANLMDEKVVIQTADERYYFSASGWKKLEKKVYAGYSVFLIIPIVAIIVFYFLSKIL